MSYRAFGLAAFLGLTMSLSAHASAPAILQKIGVHQTGVFAQGAAEIVAYDAKTQRVFKVNAQAATVDVLDLSNPSNPTLIGTISAVSHGASANSVAVHRGIVAVAIESMDKQAPGVVAFYRATDLSFIGVVPVGALPDMLTFTPNGLFVLVANEGEPDSTYTNDPEGSISIISVMQVIRGGINPVRTATFTHLNGTEAVLRAQGVRIFGPNATAAKDLEPEYITVSSDSRTAWVSLQEANALAVVDIKTAQVTSIQPLGTKNHNVSGYGLDASDRDSAVNITTWPVKGMYMPDAIGSYRYLGNTFIVTANEGDSRDYAGYTEETRVGSMLLDATLFPSASTLKTNANLGRLKATKAQGDTDGDGDYDEIYTFGARSFSIRDAQGNLIFDSGDDFETITAQHYPTYFNSAHDADNSFDSRSDDKGPEPEGLAIGTIDGKTYAFIGLERIGGIMMYDITNPQNVSFISYINARDFSVPVKMPDGSTNPLVGDLGPEGFAFIPAAKSPNGMPLLIVGNEVSGTTSVYQIDVSAITN